MELTESKEREENLKKMNDSIMSAFNNFSSQENPILVIIFVN